MTDNKRWIIIAVGIVVVLLVVSLATRFWGGSNTTGSVDKHVARRVLQAASRWSVTGEETKNPILALVHTVTAKAYTHVLRELMPEHDIARHFRVDSKMMLQSLETREAKLLRKISAAAPKLIPEGEHIGRTGWIG
jgi:allantoicase